MSIANMYDTDAPSEASPVTAASQSKPVLIHSTYPTTKAGT
jgi:hypothetical protein